MHKTNYTDKTGTYESYLIDKDNITDFNMTLGEFIRKEEQKKQKKENDMNEAFYKEHSHLIGKYFICSFDAGSQKTVRLYRITNIIDGRIVGDTILFVISKSHSLVRLEQENSTTVLKILCENNVKEINASTYNSILHNLQALKNMYDVCSLNKTSIIEIKSCYLHNEYSIYSHKHDENMSLESIFNSIEEENKKTLKEFNANVRFLKANVIGKYIFENGCIKKINDVKVGNDIYGGHKAVHLITESCLFYRNNNCELIPYFDKVVQDYITKEKIELIENQESIDKFCLAMNKFINNVLIKAF